MFEPLPLVVEAPGDMESLSSAAARAAAHWHLPPPELVRVGSNGVFRSGDVALRVGRATAPMGVALRFAERLLAAGLRVARPAREDWIETADGLSVTAWAWIDAEQDPAAGPAAGPGEVTGVDWERVGAMVATLHGMDPAGVDHPLPYCADFPWWDLAGVVPEMQNDLVDEPARAGMRAALDAHGWWADRCRHEPLTLCHGDVHPGNVLVDAGGPILIDWDLLCVGPREWDHAPLQRWTDRWGGAHGVHDAFAAGYEAAGGAPVRDDVSGAIAEMRLLIATLMRLRRARVSPGSATDEALRRLAYWRGDTDAPTWQAQ